MFVLGGLTNSWQKKRSERQMRKGKIYPSECRIPKIARRDEKAFLSDQCKETEENNRMGESRDLFKTIRDTKGKRHAKMGTIKDRNSMDLTEAEDTKKRWQEYTELHTHTQKKHVFSMTCSQCMLHKTHTSRQENTCRVNWIIPICKSSPLLMGKLQQPISGRTVNDPGSDHQNVAQRPNLSLHIFL